MLSLFSNLVNVAGNALLIYGLNMGVAGAALSTLVSRLLSAAVICFLLLHGGEIPVSRRIGLAYLLARGMDLGILGVYIAMTADWLVRGVCFATRVLTGKWEKYMGVLTRE